MRVPASQLDTSRLTAAISLVAAVPAGVGVLTVQFALAALIVHFPASVVLAFIYAGIIVMAPSIVLEMLVVQRPPAPLRARIRTWVRRPTVYVSIAVSLAWCVVATSAAYLWNEAEWDRFGTYVQLLGIALGTILCSLIGAVALAIGTDIVAAVIRRFGAWNRTILQGWTEEEIRDAVEVRLRFGRWPDPRSVRLSRAALSYLVAAARSNASRSILFGQILLLVGGALLSSAVVPIVTNAMVLLDATLTQLGSLPPDFSDVGLVPGTFGALTFAGISLAVGLCGLVLALNGAGRWQQLADLYTAARDELDGEMKPRMPRWRRVLNALAAV